MRRLVIFITMFVFVPFLSAMDSVRARRDFPECMSITQKGYTVYFSEGRPQGNPTITITPGMLKKTRVWLGPVRVKLKGNLDVAMARRLVKNDIVQAVELYFKDPSEVMNCVLRDSMSTDS